MRAQTFAETIQLKEHLAKAIGSAWVGLTQSENLFLLTLSRGFWVIDFSGPNAFCLPFETMPIKFKSVTKPLLLFAKAHFAGAELVSVATPEGAGRVILTEWRAGDHEMDSMKKGSSIDPIKKMELRLIPNQRNLILESDGKKISFAKVLPLLATSDSQIESSQRSLEEIKQDWILLKGVNQKSNLENRGTLDTTSSSIQKLKNEIAKKNATIAKVQVQIDQYANSVHRELGLWLQSHGSMSVPTQFAKLIDKKKSWQQNMQAHFELAKKEEFKKERTQKRLEWLEAELRQDQLHLVRVENGEVLPSLLPAGGALKSRVSSSKQAGAKFRRWQYKEDLLVEMGRNGAENLALLRAAKSWDLWLHIKDHPGSHLIVHRNKQRKIFDSELIEIAQWFLRQSLGRAADGKKSNSIGLAFSLLCTEVRFVSPIKGDHLGRVNYRNERVLKVKFEAKDPLDRSNA